MCKEDHIALVQKEIFGLELQNLLYRTSHANIWWRALSQVKIQAKNHKNTRVL